MARRTGRPVTPMWLGYAGLIPFFAGAIGVWVGGDAWRPLSLSALLAYAAVILSFLGGARWGVESGKAGRPDPFAMAASVVPSLIAWALLATPHLSPAWRLGGFLLAYAVQGAWDITSDTLAPWYRGLRLVLTLGAAIALGAAWVWALRGG